MMSSSGSVSIPSRAAHQSKLYSGRDGSLRISASTDWTVICDGGVPDWAYFIATGARSSSGRRWSVTLVDSAFR